jgi:hypothetical protein
MSSISYRNLHILSNTPASNDKTGSITVNGGIGVSRNIIVKEQLRANELVCEENCRIGGNLYVNGDVCLGELFWSHTQDTGISFKKNILLENGKTIGEISNRCNIYSNNIISKNIDISDDISLGSTDKNEPIIKIDKKIDNTLFINGDLFLIDDVLEINNILIEINRKNNRVNINIPTYFDNLIGINNLLKIVPQIVDLNKDIGKLQIKKSIIILENVNTSLEIDNEIEDNVVFRIIINSFYNQINNCKILLGNNTFLFTKIGQYIDILYKKKYYIIGGNF